MTSATFYWPAFTIYNFKGLLYEVCHKASLQARALISNSHPLSTWPDFQRFQRSEFFRVRRTEAGGDNTETNKEETGVRIAPVTTGTGKERGQVNCGPLAAELYLELTDRGGIHRGRPAPRGFVVSLPVNRQSVRSIIFVPFYHGSVVKGAIRVDSAPKKMEWGAEEIVCRDASEIIPPSPSASGGRGKTARE